MKKRISAFLMAIIMLFTIMPIQSTPVEATGTETQSIEFTLENSQGEILADAQVDCTVKLVSDKASAEQKQGIIATDKDGKGVLSITDTTIIEAIKNGNEIEIEYIVMVDGYSSNALTVKYDKLKADFKLTALKLFSVAISSAYDDLLGTVEINGEKKVANESVSVTEGADATLKIAPNEGYMISELKVNEISQEIAEPTSVNEFTLSGIKSNQNIEVSFVKYYTVKLAGNGNGNISVNDEADNCGGAVTSYIAENGNAVVKATPNDHYRIVSVKVDGENTDFSSNIQAGSYVKEFKNITKNYNVEITFALEMHNVKVTSKGAGSILHNGTNVGSGSSVQVEYGKSVQLELRPEAINYVEGIYINGQPENRVSELVYNADKKVYFYINNCVTDDMRVK